MGRAVKPVFLCVAVLSMVLCVGALVLWGRSYKVVDHLVLAGGGDRSTALSSCRGKVTLWLDRGGPRRRAPTEESKYNRYLDLTDFEVQLDGNTESAKRLLGFGYQYDVIPDLTSTTFRAHVRSDLRRECFTAPLWFIAGCLAIFPVTAGIMRLNSRRRARHGLCRNCGYDLRATPDRCPECGGVPTAHAARPGGAGGRAAESRVLSTSPRSGITPQ